MVRFGGVSIDYGCGLGAEVAGFRVEVQCADAMGTLRAGELHAALDALDSVGFHCLNCSPLHATAGTRWWGSESNPWRSRVDVIAAAAELCAAWTLRLPPRLRSGLRQNRAGSRGRPSPGNPGRARAPVSTLALRLSTDVTLSGGCISLEPRADGRAAGLWRCGRRCQSWFRRLPWH